MRTPLSSLNGAQGLEPCLATGCNAPLTPSVLAAAAGATGIVQQRETQVLSQNRPVPRTGPPAWRETGWFWRFAGFWSQSDENSLPSPNSYTDNGLFLTTPHCGHPVYQPAAKHRSLSPVCGSNLLEVPTHQLNEIQRANQPRRRKPVRHPR